MATLPTLGPAALAEAVITAARPYLITQRRSIGRSPPDGEWLWCCVKDKLTFPVDARAVSDLESEPDDIRPRAAATVALSRILKADQDAFAELSNLFDLEGCVTELRLRLSRLGGVAQDEALAATGREEVLAMIQEALDITARLNATRYASTDVLLDYCLDRLSRSLRWHSPPRIEEAAAAMRAAVDLRRAQAARGIDHVLHSQVASLNCICVYAYDLGRFEEALAAGQEAVEIQRRRAHDDSQYHFLARCLVSCCQALSRLGRQEEALAAILEAVDIVRRTLGTHSYIGPRQLADHLADLSDVLARLKRHDEALAAIREALDIDWRLAPSHPGFGHATVARSLGAMSDVLAALDRRQDAVKAGGKALEISTQLAEHDPLRWRPLADEMAERVRRYS